MRPRTWQIRRAYATGLAAIAFSGVLAADAAFADGYPGLDLVHSFTWGNGVESQLTDVMPTWRVNPTTQYGLVAERYVLSDYAGVEANDQAGVSASVGDPDTFQVRAELLYGSFTHFANRLNGSLDLAGATGHFKYDAGFMQTGINGAPAAADHRINTAGAGLQFGNMTARLGWASRFTSAYVAGELSNISDGNRYHFEEFGASQDFGFGSFDVVAGAFVNESGYRATLAYPRAGYYSYAAQNRFALKATLRFPVGRHFDATATGIAGTSRTEPFQGFSYDVQSYQQFAPALVYSNAGLQLSASGSFAQYLGGSYVPDYVSNAVILSARLRL